MKTVCIIQARRQSSRLKNKILMELNGKPILQHVVERCSKIKNVDQVIIAAPDDPYENKVEELANKLAIKCYRGSMDDVLARYWGASQIANSDYIMRVTADCPLIDPELCAMLVDQVQSQGMDYGTLDGWPHGLDCEVFTKDMLEEAHKHANKAVDREHVTLWIKKQMDAKILRLVPDDGDYFNSNRWVVDYPEDYEFMKAVFHFIPENAPYPDWKQILNITQEHPELKAINTHCETAWAEKTQEIMEKSNTQDQV